MHNTPPSEMLLTEMQLFAGETTFNQRRPLLKEMIEAKQSRRMTASGEPLHMLSMRGRSSNFAYSDLEGVCKTVAQEAGEGFVGQS
mmetsp:Transcript_20282/g.36780  ORF Transcript_20282/g.36780 Transcript_20282/m.36780 type:complete len:86 (-) Transcript_20282:414-671(-)